MSVVGLTFGTAAKAMRPSAANAPSVPTSATMRASGWSARTRRSRRSARARGSQRPRAASSCRHLDSARAQQRDTVGGHQRTAGSAEDPRGLGGEIRPAGEHLGRGAVGDHTAIGEQHDAVGEGGRELGVVGGDDDGGVEALSRRTSASLAARSMPLVGSSRPTIAGGSCAPDRRARSRARAAASHRRSGHADDDRQAAARPTAASAPSPPRRAPSRAPGSPRVLQQQRDAARGIDPAAGGLHQARGVTSRVDLPAPFLPISATRSPGAIRRSRSRRIVGPSLSSCQTRLNRSADSGSVPTPSGRRSWGTECSAGSDVGRSRADEAG